MVQEERERHEKEGDGLTAEDRAELKEDLQSPIFHTRKITSMIFFKQKIPQKRSSQQNSTVARHDS
jgi:hypothetical protein